MPRNEIRALIDRLSRTARTSLDKAAQLAIRLANYDIEIEHWLAELAAEEHSDAALVLRALRIEPLRVHQDLIAAADRFERGNTQTPALSRELRDIAFEAVATGVLRFQGLPIRSAYILHAAMSRDATRRRLIRIAPRLEAATPERIEEAFANACAESAEAREQAATSPAHSRPNQNDPNPNATPSTNAGALGQFTVDMTAAAGQGQIDPVFGRDPEIRQIIDILSRRRQNNPILTGESGVGKTAVVEGFAIRIAQGDVPDAIKEASLLSLDLGLLQAGASVKGEFENRLRSVIDEVKSAPNPIILFIDEAHTLVGAGGAEGQGDAANLLKPALARGELRTIAATTWSEYKKYFEKDAALSRRFQVVKVEEPDLDAAADMTRGVAAVLERHHAVNILDEAITEAVRLSQRYITGRQLPEKSVALLDTACARVGLSQGVTPASIEDLAKRLEAIARTSGALERETAIGLDHNERITETRNITTQLTEQLESLAERYQQERELVQQVHKIEQTLAPTNKDETEERNAEIRNQETATPPTKTNDNPAPNEQITQADAEQLLKDLAELREQLKHVQGEHPLVHPAVDAQAVAEVVSAWTGIPLGRMVADEVQTIINLRQRMEQRIVGQSHALEVIAKRIQTARAQLVDPERPIGVFLLVGTSGVGKTETAITLADLLYGGEQNMTTINMSEFKEEHKVSLLMGSPPGYVGYGEVGVLTEAVRRKPYSVVLLDEMEKAHNGVQDVFYQVFDKGNMRDGQGRDINFRNTVIIMTSNAATERITELCVDVETPPDPEQLAERIYPELLHSFKPAFLGRVSIVPFYPLADGPMAKIIELKLNKVRKRVREHYNATFDVEQSVIDAIRSRCREVQTGARNIDQIVANTMLPALSREFLNTTASGKAIAAVRVALTPAGDFDYQIKTR